MRKQPVRPAGNSGEKYRHISFMPDQMPAGPDKQLIWIRDHFGCGELDQPAIVFNEFTGFQGWKAFRVEEQILFHFIPDDFRERKPAEPRRAK